MDTYQKHDPLTRYEAVRRLQDVRDIFALADDHLSITRCIGGRLQNYGYACTFCQSFEPDKLCKAPMGTQVEKED